MSKAVKPQSVFFLASLAGSGFLLIVIGTLFRIIQHTLSAEFCTALGAAVLGAAISLVLARFFEPSEMSQLMQAIAEAHAFPLTRDDTQIQPFRTKYYGYLRSHDPDGKPVWRYRVFDFSQALTPGHLHAMVTVAVSEETNKTYVYDGFVCGQHLMLVGRAKEGAEPFVIHVFPNGCILEGDHMAGLCFVRSFYGQQLVAPTILSTRALTNQARPGTVDDANGQRLSKIWADRFVTHNVFNYADLVNEHGGKTTLPAGNIVPTANTAAPPVNTATPSPTGKIATPSAPAPVSPAKRRPSDRASDQDDPAW